MKGTLIAAQWQAKFFKWPANLDPRQDLGGYRKLAEGPAAVSAQLAELSLRYGMRGPSELGISEAVTAAKLGRDHFGMIARTRLPLAKGTWQFGTLSDDGVRVSVDGKPVIENWAWHGPTRDQGEVTLPADQTVEIVVEHFQIDGYAVLDFSLSRKAESRFREAGRAVVDSRVLALPRPCSLALTLSLSAGERGPAPFASEGVTRWGGGCSGGNRPPSPRVRGAG